MTKVAAIQMHARVGDLAYNLQHAETLLLEAIKTGAKVIALPEFFTTTIVLDHLEGVRRCVLPPDNIALDMLIKLCKRHQVLIGGSYLELRPESGDVFNCYVLVRPDGSVTRHDKDRPTMIENAFYVEGKTQGIHSTDYGAVGTAVCWETIRTQTVKRLQGNIDFLMTGSHWWTTATNCWNSVQKLAKTMDKRNRSMLSRTPARLSKMLGVANIHASHCGEIKGLFPLLPGRLLDLNFETELIGETQIVDNQGNSVARRLASEGPGVITADIELTRQSASMALPERYWIPNLSLIVKMYWWQQNYVAKGIYKRAKRKGCLSI